MVRIEASGLALSRVKTSVAGRKISASFIFGSPELMEWVDGNDRIKMLRTEITNDPARIARTPDLSRDTAEMVGRILGD